MLIYSYKFLLTISSDKNQMKKVRISRRDPTKILKAIDHQSPKKKSLKKNHIDREQVKSLNLKLYSYDKNETIHSHRYKIS